MADFRAERMPSPEGEGRAKHALEDAWDAYHSANKAINKPLLATFPWIKKALAGYTGSATIDLFGFWLVWRLFGGFEGLQQHLGMSRSTIYRRISSFRAVFGEHPDVYEFDGISIDVEAFIRDFATKFPGKPEQPTQ